MAGPAALQMIQPGKATRVIDAPTTKTVLPEVVTDLVVAIPNENRRLIISLAKKMKIGRLRGANNKSKLEGAPKPKPKADMPRSKIKGKKKSLTLMVEETTTSSH